MVSHIEPAVGSDVDGSVSRIAAAKPPDLSARAQDEQGFTSADTLSNLIDFIEITVVTFAGIISLLFLLILASVFVLVGRSKKELQDGLDRQIDANAASRGEFERRVEKRLDDFFEVQEGRYTRFEDQLEQTVQRLIANKTLDVERSVEGLVAKSNELIASISNFEEIRDVLRERIRRDTPDDPHLRYSFARYVATLPSDPNDSDYVLKRQQAVTYLESVIESGVSGKVEGNTLFNAGQVAAGLDLDDISLRLFTLANSLVPSVSHAVAMYRMQTALGRRYIVRQQDQEAPSDLSSLTFDISDMEPRQISRNAFDNALTAAADARLAQCNIVYSELWNIAEKMREERGYERMRDVLLAVVAAREGNEVNSHYFTTEDDRNLFEEYDWARQTGRYIPSILYEKIAEVYAAIGVEDWREKYRAYIGRAIKLLSEESKNTTWRGPLLSSARVVARTSGEDDYYDSLLTRYEIEEDTAIDGTSLLRALFAAQEAKRAEDVIRDSAAHHNETIGS